MAALNDLERVRVEMGHTTSRTTSEHYVNAVRARDAAAFWALLPDAPARGKVIRLPKSKSA